MESPWSSNIKSILKRIDIRCFTRVEQYTRCQITNPASKEYYLKYYEPIIHQNYSPLNNLINQKQ